MPARVLVLVAVVATAGAAAAGATLHAWGVELGAAPLLVALGALATVAKARPFLVVRHGEGQEIHFDDAVLAAMLLVLPPGGVVAVAVSSTVVAHVVRRRSMVKAVYNHGIQALAVAVAVSVHVLIVGPDAGRSVETVASAGAAALLSSFVTMALVWLAIAAATGQRLRRLALPDLPFDVLTTVGAVAWGLFAVVGSSHPAFTVLLLFAPIVVSLHLHQAERQRHHLQSLLRAAVSTAGAVRSGTVSSAVVDAARASLRTDHAEIRPSPPGHREIGRPVNAAGDAWLVVGGRHVKDPFRDHDEALLDGLSAIASIAIDNESLVDVVGRDPVTELPYGALLTERVAAALADDAHPGLTAVLVVKLARFGIVKQTFGPGSSNAVLAEIGARLDGLAGAHPLDALGTSTAGYLGDGEFALVVQDVRDRDHALEIARRVNDAVDPPVVVDGVELVVTVSIGVALGDTHGAPDTGVTPGDLVRDALATASRIAGSGGAPVQIAESGSGAAMAARLGMEAELRRALEDGDLRVHYQPVVDVASGRLSGAEALVRWYRAGGGVILPADFVPVAEESGLIVGIDRMVLTAACEQLVAWQRAGTCGSAFRMSVNLSARHLAEPDLVDFVAGVVQRTGVAPASVVLEVTESGVMHDASSAATTLRALHDIGVQLAIDDFGTGYSSLAYLRDFAVDALKVDRSFVAGMTHRAGDEAIVAATIQLAHTLGLRVVAEGVEEVVQLEALRVMGCEDAQGFLWHAPMHPDDFVASSLIASDHVEVPHADGHDVSAAARAEREQQARWEAFFVNAVDGVMFTAPDGQILAANAACCELLGYTEDEIRALGRGGLADPADRRWASAVAAREATGAFRGELSFRRKDGSTFPAEVSSGIFPLDDEERTCVIIRDASERRAVELELRARAEELADLALADDLTGLPNRRAAIEAVARQMHGADRSGSPFSIVMADLDGLKAINDRHGHATGDRALRAAAKVLQRAFRRADLVARLSGDEFVVLLATAIGEVDDHVARIDRIAAAVETALALPVRLGISAGTATYDPSHPVELAELMADADDAMYRDKLRRRTGRGAAASA